jgi:hypothetical protein
LGVGIAPGRQLRETSPIYFAPTLAALLRLTPPSNSEGHILSEAFAVRR